MNIRPAELRVLKLVAYGFKTDTIAKILHLESSTIIKHIHNALVRNGLNGKRSKQKKIHKRYMIAQLALSNDYKEMQKELKQLKNQYFQTIQDFKLLQKENIELKKLQKENNDLKQTILRQKTIINMYQVSMQSTLAELRGSKKCKDAIPV